MATVPPPPRPAVSAVYLEICEDVAEADLEVVDSGRRQRIDHVPLAHPSSSTRPACSFGASKGGATELDRQRILAVEKVRLAQEALLAAQQAAGGLDDERVVSALEELEGALRELSSPA